MALQKLVEARRTAVESIAKGHGQLKKYLSLLTSAQAGIDVLKKAKVEISKSFKNKVTNVVAPKRPQPTYMLNKEINAVAADPDMKTRLAGLGVGLVSMTSAEFGKFIADETEKWGKVIRAADIKAE